MTQDPQDPGTEREVACIFFTCGTQRWGARLGDLTQIAALPEETLSPVPRAPLWALRLFLLDLRPAILVDPALFLGIPASWPQPPREGQALLVTRRRRALFGLFVADLSQAAFIPEQDFVPVDATSASAPPFALARYAPRGAPDPFAEGAALLLDVRQMAGEMLIELMDGEEADDDLFFTDVEVLF